METLELLRIVISRHCDIIDVRNRLGRGFDADSGNGPGGPTEWSHCTFYRDFEF